MKSSKLNLLVSGICATSIAASLSLLNIFPASANTTSSNNRSQNYALVSSEQNMSNSIAPNNLVESAYRGAFKGVGVPSYISFLTEIRENKLTAKDLVQSAIAERKLLSDTINNSEYIHGVSVALQNMAQSDV